MTSIAIPESITEIGEGTFDGCSSLKDFTFPSQVTKISDYLFSNCGFTSFDIPDTITEIAAGAFACCNKLTDIHIPESVKEIKNGAFYNCTALTSIVLPKTLKKLGKTVFEGCTALTSVTLLGGPTKLEEKVFTGCTALETLTLGSGIKKADENMLSLYVEEPTDEGWKQIRRTSQFPLTLKAIYVPPRKKDYYEEVLPGALHPFIVEKAPEKKAKTKK